MVIAGVQNVSAFGGNDKENVNLLVLGKEESKSKFLRIFLNKTEPCFGDSIPYNETTKINFAFPSEDNNIPNYIKNGYITTASGNKHRFKVILAVVDTDQDVDNVKKDIRDMVDSICDYKDPYTQLIIVGCTDRENVLNTDDSLTCLSNYIVGIERECTFDKWGTLHNISFDEQFLGSFWVSKYTTKEDFCGSIIESVKIYDYLKKKTDVSLCDFIVDNKYKIATIATVPIMAIVICAIFKSDISKFVESFL